MQVASQREEEAQRLAEEKAALESATSRLRESLVRIQQRAEELQSEKDATETRLHTAESAVKQIAGKYTCVCVCVCVCVGGWGFSSVLTVCA